MFLFIPYGMFLCLSAVNQFFRVHLTPCAKRVTSKEKKRCLTTIAHKQWMAVRNWPFTGVFMKVSIIFVYSCRPPVQIPEFWSHSTIVVEHLFLKPYFCYSWCYTQTYISFSAFLNGTHQLLLSGCLHWHYVLHFQRWNHQIYNGIPQLVKFEACCDAAFCSLDLLLRRPLHVFITTSTGVPVYVFEVSSW